MFDTEGCRAPPGVGGACLELAVIQWHSRRDRSYLNYPDITIFLNCGRP